MSASDKDDDDLSTHSASHEFQPNSSPAISDTLKTVNEIPGYNDDRPSDYEMNDKADATSSQRIIMSPADLENTTEIADNVSPLRRATIQQYEILNVDDNTKELITEESADNINLRGNEPIRKKSVRGVPAEKQEDLSKKFGELTVEEEKETTEDEIDHKPIEEAESSEETEQRSPLKRRKSTFLTEETMKDDFSEPYKIDIPLKKKVNHSTKKKLWREIERRKPFITQNVAEHIQKFAKPPFVTWGCKNCEYSSEA